VFLEIGFAEHDVVHPRGGSERPRAGDVGRVEVGCENLGRRICCCDEICREALTAAEITVGEGLSLQPGRGNTFGEGGEAQDRGRLDSAKVITYAVSVT
jgi:hypothetical protein